MKLLPNALIATTILMASPAAIDGFTPPVLQPTTTRGFKHSSSSSSTVKSRGSSTQLFSSTLPPKTNGEQVTTPTLDEKSLQQQQQEQQQKAVDALQRLMSRQQSELEETKRLLELYNSLNNNHNNSTKFSTTNLSVDDEAELLSVASAVLKGFDYGFQSRSDGPSFKTLKGGNEAFVGYGPPANIWALGSQQFMRNLNAMRNEYEDEDDVEYTPKQIELQTKLEQLTLNSTAIWERETKDGPIEAPLVIKIPYLVLCWLLDVVFEGKYVPSRFFLLETVARMPYFSYIAMLHLYETLGFWRRSADMKRIHFAEELNEFRHLLIMESLGGDQQWWVRFMAQHSAIAYYVGLCFLWALSPSLSYKFSELLETHAVNTYSEFLDENEEILKELPPSLAAVDYYALGASDPYYAEFQTTAISNNEEIRRPGLNMNSLYDVFSAIRDDEGDHVSTMEACLDPNVAKLSPSLEKKVLTGIAAAAAVAFFINTGVDIGIVSEEFAELADGVDAAADAAGIGSGLIDAAIAGVAGLASQLGQEAEEGLMEEGGMMTLTRFGEEILAFFSRFL